MRNASPIGTVIVSQLPLCMRRMRSNAIGPGGPAKPHSHRALLKIVRSFHQFLCALARSLGTAIDQQNRIASRNVDEHQISDRSLAPTHNFLVTISYISEFMTRL